MDRRTRLDEIAAEGHSFFATAAERTRRENTWVLVLEGSERIDPKTGWRWYNSNPSASSSFFGMATVFMVAIFFMVTDIKMG